MKRRPERVIAEDRGLSTIQKMLLLTDGTLTPLLELLAKERIRIRKIAQRVCTGADELLAAGEDDEILHREVLLCGESAAYAHAESRFVLARLPSRIRRQLDAGRQPIGRLWRDAKLETYRELLDYRREPVGSLGRHFAVASDVDLLARTYLVRHARKPLGVITERFPTTCFK